MSASVCVCARACVRACVCACVCVMTHICLTNGNSAVTTVVRQVAEIGLDRVLPRIDPNIEEVTNHWQPC